MGERLKLRRSAVWLSVSSLSNICPGKDRESIFFGPQLDGVFNFMV